METSKESPRESPLKGCPEGKSQKGPPGSPPESPWKDFLKGPPESPLLNPPDPTAESSGQPPHCPPVSSALPGRGGSVEAAPGGFDLLAAATRRCLMASGAQIRQGRRQAGQVPHASLHPQGSRDLPVGQLATQEEDSGVLGGKTLKNPGGGEARKAWQQVEVDSRRAAAGNMQAAASAGYLRTPMCPPWCSSTPDALGMLGGGKAPRAHCPPANPTCC